jgi:Chaperone of endosialidase
MKTKTYILLFVLFGFTLVTAQDKKNNDKRIDETKSIKTINSTQATGDQINFKDATNHTLIRITDEGTVGSITIPPGSSAPSVTNNKLYNISGTLYFGNGSLGSGGASSLNDLSDAIFDGSSLFVGAGAGATDDGSNDNTAVGTDVLHSNTSGIQNTALGNSALYSNTSGNNNTAEGYNALYSNTTGYHNTANGYQALYHNVGNYNTANGTSSLFNNTTGQQNTASGISSLYSNTTGSYNTAYGCLALFSNTVGFNNTATGFYSLRKNTTGNLNTATGDSALFSNTTGNYNTSTGAAALQSNTEGEYNSANGYKALYLNTTGAFNLADGDFALFSNTTGNNNTATGDQALYSNTADDNTANGSGALYSNTSGNNNVANGYQALYSNTAGNSNVCIGVSAGYSNQTGSRNTMIGYQAGYGSLGYNQTGNVFIGYKAGNLETGNNKLYIENSTSLSPLIWGDFTDNRVVINGNSSSDSTKTFFVNGAGGTSAWANLSDIRLKENIKTIPDALNKVKSLRGINFEWKDKEKFGEGLQMGFVAQEVEKVVPEVVDTKGEYYTMQYAPVTALLVEAVKKLSKQNEINEQNRKIRTEIRQGRTFRCS